MLLDWIAVIIVGALIGWLASLIMGTNMQQGAIANIVIGIIGSLLGRFIFANVFGVNGATAAGTFSFAGLFWGVVGAIILIAVLKAFRVLT
jgi:uncharacterized membrane protein YeaQ/YmgE (transglycosylase-associated protein family)